MATGGAEAVAVVVVVVVAVVATAAAAAVAVGRTDLTTPATGSAETGTTMTGWEDLTSRIDGIGTTMSSSSSSRRDTGEMNEKNRKTPD